MISVNARILIWDLYISIWYIWMNRLQQVHLLKLSLKIYRFGLEKNFIWVFCKWYGKLRCNSLTNPIFCVYVCFVRIRAFYFLIKKSHWTYKFWSLHCSHHIILTKKNILTFTCVFHLLSQKLFILFSVWDWAKLTFLQSSLKCS